MRISDWSSDVCSSDLALDDLIRQGKVRYIGNSNFTGWQIADADWTARQLGLNRFVSAQDELSLVFRKTEEERLRSEEHTSELQSLMRISYAVFCLKKKKQQHEHQIHRK